MGPEDPTRRAVVPLGLSLTLPLGNYLTSRVGNYLTRSALKLGLCVTFDTLWRRAFAGAEILDQGLTVGLQPYQI